MKARTHAGFTLVELLVVIAIIAVLATIISLAAAKVTGIARASVCSNSLRQLATVIHLYADDHGDKFPPYVDYTDEGRIWYFGYEPGSGSSEGKRDLKREQGPLYPYLGGVGVIEICPSFDYANALYKPKFKGASWAYGYNWVLGGTFQGASQVMRRSQVFEPGELVLFADCGQVNAFQAPASPSKPMIEEFYLISPDQDTVHFRHQGKAQAVFLDGHVRRLEPVGRVDPRLKSETIGRIDPKYFGAH